MTKRIDNLRKRAHETEVEVQRLKSQLRVANAEVHKLNVEILRAKEDERKAIDAACTHFGKVACAALFSSKEDGTTTTGYAAISYKPKHGDGEYVELSDEETACILEGYIAGVAAMNTVEKFYDREELAGDDKLRVHMTNTVLDAVNDYYKQFIEPETEPETEDAEYASD